jgi:hypothetical protein
MPARRIHGKERPDMEPASGAERRCFPRFPFHSKAVLVLDGIPYEGTLLDLSLSGALFRARAALVVAAGECCRLDILHGAARDVARANGRIAYAQEDVLGLQFQQLDLGAQQGLTQIVEMNLGTREMMKRELAALLSSPAGRLR